MLGAFETAVTIYSLRDGDLTPLKTCGFDSPIVIVHMRYYSFSDIKRGSEAVCSAARSAGVSALEP